MALPTNSGIPGATMNICGRYTFERRLSQYSIIPGNTNTNDTEERIYTMLPIMIDSDIFCDFKSEYCMIVAMANAIPVPGSARKKVSIILIYRDPSQLYGSRSACNAS